MIPKSMPSGHDPMGGDRLSEKIMLNFFRFPSSRRIHNHRSRRYAKWRELHPRNGSHRWLWALAFARTTPTEKHQVKNTK
jgi:hypothetical protein